MAANLKILFALTLVHFTGAFYTAFINPLFPVFVDKLGLKLTQVGIIAGTMRFLAFIIQPTVGYLADRYKTRAFIFIGLSLSIVFIPLSGIAPNFWLLLLCVALGSVGSSMFHPSVTRMVPLYAGTKASFSMSIFNTGGTLASGPIPPKIPTVFSFLSIIAFVLEIFTPVLSTIVVVPLQVNSAGATLS